MPCETARVLFLRFFAPLAVTGSAGTRTWKVEVDATVQAPDQLLVIPPLAMSELMALAKGGAKT
eukprot:124640-Amphidinium_carterae.2